VWENCKSGRLVLRIHCQLCFCVFANISDAVATYHIFEYLAHDLVNTFVFVHVWRRLIISCVATGVGRYYIFTYLFICVNSAPGSQLGNRAAVALSRAAHSSRIKSRLLRIACTRLKKRPVPRSMPTGGNSPSCSTLRLRLDQKKPRRENYQKATISSQNSAGH
jgi:hypothetical protein